MEEKGIYLKQGIDILYVLAHGYNSDQGFCQIDAGVYLCDLNFRILGMMYAILGPYENEVTDLKSMGWVEVRPRSEA